MIIKARSKTPKLPLAKQEKNSMQKRNKMALQLKRIKAKMRGRKFKQV